MRELKMRYLVSKNKFKELIKHTVGVMLSIALIADDSIAIDNADDNIKYLQQKYDLLKKETAYIQSQLQVRSSNNNSIAQDREDRSIQAINQLQSAKHNIARLRDQEEFDHQELNQLITKRKALEARIEEYKDEFNRSQEEIEDLKSKFVDYKTQLDEIDLRLNALSHNNNVVLVPPDSQQNQIVVLENGDSDNSLSESLISGHIFSNSYLQLNNYYTHSSTPIHTSSIELFNYDDDSDNEFEKSIAGIEEMLAEELEDEPMSGDSAVGIKIADSNESMSEIVNQELHDMKKSLEKQGLIEEEVEAVEDILKQEGTRKATSERLNLEKGKLYQGVSQLARHGQLQIASTEVAHNLIRGRLGREDILSAISAGEEESGSSRYGIWSSGIYSTYKQKEHGSRSGYMGNMLGGTIGVDYSLDSGLLVGAAYSTMNSRNKHQLGDNRKYIRQSTDIVSLYGSDDLGKDVSIYAIGSISRSRAFKSRSKQLSLESYLNYKINIPSGIIIIPNISIKYNYVMMSGYRGKISDNYLLEYGKVNDQILSGEIGSRIMFAPIKLSSDVALTPTAHIAIEKRIVAKGISKPMTLSLQDIWDSSKTLSITSYSNHEKNGIKVGGGIIASYKNIRLGLLYDMRKQKSYKSHQRVINFKVQL